MRGGEGGLLDFGKVVCGVLVEGELADGAEGVFGLRPDFGEVEDGVLEFFGLGLGHGLDVDGPRGIFLLLDGLKEVLGVEVGIRGGELAGLLVGEGLGALVRLEVDLDIVERSILLHKLVGVSGVSVHVPIRRRGTAVAEEMHNLMNRLLVLAQVIPKHGRILQIRLRVPLLRMDKNRKLGRVPQEEDGRVVEHPIAVSLLGIELDGKPTGIASGVGRALLASNGGEPHKGFGLLAEAGEEVGTGEVRDVVRYLEGTEGASAFGVDDTVLC